MHIDVVIGRAAFQNLAQKWQRIYEADPAAHVFLSHPWLAAWASLVEGQWLVLGARSAADAEDYIGLFPLRLRTKSRPDGRPSAALVPSGVPAADFAGFLCLPDEENKVARGFGIALAQLRQDRIHLDNLLLPEGRLAALLNGAARSGGRVVMRQSIDNGDGVDQSLAPVVRLSAHWEAQLAKFRPNTRQKARRFLRKLDEGDELAVSHATVETLERHANILLRLWLANWTARKGERAIVLAAAIQRTVTGFFSAGLMDLCVLWRDGIPLAAHALYVDPVQRATYFSVGACDKSVQSPPPSFLLHCYSMRKAILDGHLTYEFLRGNEPYKASFTGEARQLRNASIAYPAPSLRAGSSGIHAHSAVAEGEAAQRAETTHHPVRERRQTGSSGH